MLLSVLGMCSLLPPQGCRLGGPILLQLLSLLWQPWTGGIVWQHGGTHSWQEGNSFPAWKGAPKRLGPDGLSYSRSPEPPGKPVLSSGWSEKDTIPPLSSGRYLH